HSVPAWARLPGRASRATGQGFEAVEHVARFQHVVALRDGLVARHEPRLVLGGLRADRRPVAKLEGRPRRSLGEEASKRAVHHHRDRHWPAARTRGITSAWNRSIVCSMRPSGATGYIISWVAPSRARRTTPAATSSGGPASVTASTKLSGTSAAAARYGRGS